MVDLIQVNTAPLKTTIVSLQRQLADLQARHDELEQQHAGSPVSALSPLEEIQKLKGMSVHDPAVPALWFRTQPILVNTMRNRGVSFAPPLFGIESISFLTNISSVQTLQDTNIVPVGLSVPPGCHAEQMWGQSSELTHSPPACPVRFAACPLCGASEAATRGISATCGRLFDSIKRRDKYVFVYGH